MGLPSIEPVSLADIKDDGVSGRRTIVPAGHYARRPPFYVDTARADKATVAALSEYLGAVDQAHGPIEVCALPEATVIGQGAVVTRNNELVRETVLEFLAHGSIPDGLTVADGALTVSVPLTRRINVPCVLAKRPWFRNFGHFLVDAAALLALVAEDCMRERWTIVLGDVGDSPLKNVMQETVRHLLPDNPVLFHPDNEAWQFKDLRYVTPVHLPPLFKLPAALAKLRGMFQREPGPADPGLKLFVIRGTGPHLRALANSNQVMQLCGRRGYKLLNPEGLSIRQAAAVFGAASAVIGVKGAALTNTVFCRPGSAVMSLSPADFPDPFFWDLCAQRGISYGELFGPVTTTRPQSHNDFVIEPVRLEAMLDAAGRLTGPV